MGTDLTGIDVPLLASKLLVPPVPAEIVERPRLHRLLDRSAGRALTVVAAPAGWGKTVLLSTWAAAAPRTGRVAWLAAEPGDDRDQIRRYLWAAFRRAVPASPAGNSPPPTGSLARAIAGSPRPITMIVDGLDRVTDPLAWEDLDSLLRHARGRLRLVVATRTAPPAALHRWALGGELAEVGATDLAFTPDETARMVEHHGLCLPPANLRDLQRRTEGWPAGLWLAVARLAELPAEERRVGRPGGDDPQIGAYLLAEVLAEQPDDVQEAMITISVPDRVCASLAEALTGRADGQRLLVELASRATLLAPLDDSATWYRMNPLLGEALRAELRRRHPYRTPELHARAARWFAGQALAADALRHALASGDRRLVVRVLGEHWHRLLPSGHRPPAAVDTAQPPGSVARTDPEVALACAARRLELHDDEGAEAYLRLAARRDIRRPAGTRDRFTVATTAFRLAQARLRGDVPGMSAAAAAILEALDRPASDSPDYDDAAAAVALTALGTTRLLDGDICAAEAALREGCGYAAAAHLRCEGLVGRSRLAFARALRGQLGAARRTARAALSSARCSGQSEPGHCAHAYAALALVALHRGQLADAASNADRAARLWDGTDEPAFTATITVLRAQILLESRQWGRGQEAISAARRSMPAHGHTGYLRDLVAAVEADLLTAHGGPIAACERLAPLLVNGSPGIALRVAYARACLRNRDPRAAAATAASCLSHHGADGQLPLRLAAGLVHAEAAWRLGDGPGAWQSLERVLALAEPEDFRQIFTGVNAPRRELLLEHLHAGTAHRPFLTSLLQAQHRAGPATGAQALPEPLTERELTILRYLQSLLSNVEIAGELSVSVNTVKTHVRNIYRKLSACHRRDAVRRARDLRLL